MSDNTYILGIETSCDETAAAVTKNGLDVLSNVIASQVDWHKKFGGVVPEIASRKHLEFINPVIDEALAEAGIGFTDINAVAVTYGPGLVGGLLVGLSQAKAISYALDIPLIGVNHIAGHIYANFISRPDIKTPVICLTISGGHTDLLYFEDLEGYEILGRTRDDAAGEAFDKIARFLDLGYPGGPVIEREAEKGDPDAIDFPRASLGKDNYDFSFSGLKTAVINHVHNQNQRGEDLNIPDIAASFQQAVIDSLLQRVIKAVQDFEVNSVVLSGGVAANTPLRNQFQKKLSQKDIPVYYPELKLCTDNAAMIAAVGYFQYEKGDFADLSLNAKPSLKL